MSKKDNNTQEQKPKVCGLAKAALFVPVIMWGLGFCGTLCGWILWVDFYNNAPRIIKALCGVGPLTVYMSLLVAIILSVSALKKITASAGMLKGKHFAIEAILISIALQILYLWFCINARGWTASG